MYRLSYILLSLTLAFNLSALELNSAKPGTLSAEIETPETLTDLTVRGEIDVRDLQFIAVNMTALRTLNLADASIVAYSGSVKGLAAFEFSAGEIPATVFAASQIENFVFPAKQTLTVGAMAFCGGKIKTLALADNVVEVGVGAFGACEFLTSVSVSGLRSIGRYAFADCKSLVSVSFRGVERIEQCAFVRCEKLKDISGVGSLVEIGDGAFAGCSSLSAFDFGSKLTAVGNEAFASTALKSVDMSDCKVLCSIGDFAFANCDKLTEIFLPQSLTTLGRGAFFGDLALADIKLPSGLIDLDDYTLKGLEKVTQLTLPSSIERVGTLAMSGMNRLSTIVASDLDVVPVLGEDVWDRIDKSKVKLVVPDALASDFRAASQWQDFDIIDSSSASVSDEPLADAFAVRGRFVGAVLEVDSQDAEMERIDMFDSAGRLLLSRRVNSTTASVDCSNITEKLLIVLVTTKDARRATVKLVKNG